MITCNRCGNTTKDEHSIEDWDNLFYDRVVELDNTKLYYLCKTCQQDYLKIEGEWDKIVKGFWNYGKEERD
jgi:hypothetical protein